MPKNEITLQSGEKPFPVDENLRPLKVGGEDTALELSKTDVKVNNLIVGGTTNGVSASDSTKLPLAGGTMTGDITTDSDIVSTGAFKLNCEGNIELDTNSSSITFSKDDDNQYIFALDASGAVFTIYEAPGSSDRFRITVVEHGLTVIQTIDDAAEGADLSITADGYLKLSSVASEDSTLDSGNDIILDANTGITKFKLAGDADDLCTLTVAANGVTTIATADSDGIAGHLTLAPDGALNLDAAKALTLNSVTGAFIYEEDSTQFSVANSAYAGTILGYTTVGIDAADDSYTLTTSFAVTDSAHKVKFVAPPSGVVEIFVSIFHDSTRRILHLGLSDNATYNALDVTHEHDTYVPGGTIDELQINHTWVITGLTSGTAYEYWLGAKITAGAGGVLRWGGNVTGEYPPFIMKATALPAAVADYAVYG